jgi:hypothetical protein
VGAAATTAATGSSLWSKIAPIANIGGNILSSVLGYNAAKTAAQQQVAAQQQALGIEQNIYNQSIQNLSPYTSAGSRAITSLRGLTGNS